MSQESDEAVTEQGQELRIESQYLIPVLEAELAQAVKERRLLNALVSQQQQQIIKQAHMIEAMQAEVSIKKERPSA